MDLTEALAPARAVLERSSASWWKRVLRWTLDWVPVSKKNRPRIVRFGNRISIRPSAAWGRDEKKLRALAWNLVRELEAAVPLIPGDHDFGAIVAHLVAKREADDEVLVEIYDLGPDGLPKGRRRGTRRDIQNIPEGILDALQGTIYPDDKRCKALVVQRIYVD